MKGKNKKKKIFLFLSRPIIGAIWFVPAPSKASSSILVFGVLHFFFFFFVVRSLGLDECRWIRDIDKALSLDEICVSMRRERYWRAVDRAQLQLNHDNNNNSEEIRLLSNGSRLS